MRQDLECSIWSERRVDHLRIDPPVRGHLLIRIPWDEWLAFAEWCRDGEWKAITPRLADLCANEVWEVAREGRKGLILHGGEIRKLATEAHALSTASLRTVRLAARDKLLAFLEEATDIVDFYEGKPFDVKVVFLQRII